MKQQYSILRNEDNTRLIIREFGELDKDMLSLLCEESYDDEAVSNAVAAGKEKVISVLRTKNLYPPPGARGKDRRHGDRLLCHSENGTFGYHYR